MQYFFRLLSMCFLIPFLGCNPDEDCCDPNPPGGESDCESIEFNGHNYSLAEINGDCWFAENLKSNMYQNGDVITYEPDENEWIFVQEGARCVMYNDESLADIYGYLYNWNAAVDPRNLCPSGWHVGDSLDFENLIISSGGLNTALKATTSWVEEDENSDDALGIGALAGGMRTGDLFHADYLGQGYNTKFWLGQNCIGENSGPTLTLRTMEEELEILCQDWAGTGAYVRCVRD